MTAHADRGGDLTSPHHAGVPPENSPAVSQPAAGAFWQHRWNDQRRWTPERDAYLKAAWERGDKAADIQAAVNAMPGPPITGKRAITSQVRARGYFRPGWYRQELVRQGGLALSPWTDERRAYVREAYTRGDSVQDILAALNAMPGDQIPSITSIRNWCEHHKVHRPKNYGPAAAAAWKHQHGVWNPDRRAKLVELWADPRLTCPEIAAIINAIPGPRELSPNACQRKAWDLKLPARPRGPKPQAVKAPRPPRIRVAKPKPEKPAVQKQRLGERNTFVFCAQNQPREPDEPPPEYDAARPGSVESRVEKAKAMLRRRQDTFDIAKATGLPLWRVLAIVGQLRMERQG